MECVGASRKFQVAAPAPRAATSCTDADRPAADATESCYIT